MCIRDSFCALPNVSVDTDGVYLYFIRQDWLDKLGLEVPKTVAELGEVAQKFKDAGLSLIHLLTEYKKYRPNSEYHEGRGVWVVKADLALPLALLYRLIRAKARCLQIRIHV